VIPLFTSKKLSFIFGSRYYDLILINENFPDCDAIDFVKTIKTESPQIPVIVISSNRDNSSEIRALHTGASDYIRTPFDMEVFIARIEACLHLNGNKIISIEEFVISPDQGEVTYQGQKIDITGKALQVLTHLARRRDEIVSKQQLRDALWAEPNLFSPTVTEASINKIRKLIDKPYGITTIETVRRRGYRFTYPKVFEIKSNQ